MKSSWKEPLTAIMLMLGAGLVFVLLEFGSNIGDYITKKHFSTNYKYYKK